MTFARRVRRPDGVPLRLHLEITPVLHIWSVLQPTLTLSKPSHCLYSASASPRPGRRRRRREKTMVFIVTQCS